MRRPYLTLRRLRYWLPFLGLLTIGGCATEPTQRVAARQEAPPVDTNVYFYTPQGQAATSSAQQDRDKYDCYVWATQQSGFDPSLPEVPPHLHVRLVGGPPPGTDVAAGALTGAVLGAAVSDPWHAGQGTLIGALAGAAIGGIADAEQSSRNHQVEAQTNAQLTGARSAATEHEALEFRRAMTACLEGHGYVVR